MVNTFQWMFVQKYWKGNIIEEYVTYSEVKFNVAIPKEITNFKIPDSVKIENVEL